MDPAPERFAEAPLLRGLVGGFALVLLLLGAAGFVAVQGTHAIEANTARVVHEQLVMARLLNDAQAGQNMLAAVLHQLTRSPNLANEVQLLRDLEAADAALDRVARSASSTPESSRWTALHESERAFSLSVREAIRNQQARAPEVVLSKLFDQHSDVVRLEEELLHASEHRVSEAERKVEEESRRLATSSVLLLGACLALAVLCAALTVVFARNSIRAIEWHASELSRVSWHMLQSQEETARRFSHELHDELGQSLAAVRANLTSASPVDWSRRREDCVQLVDAAIANVRELSQLLRPVILDDFGLDASLRWLSEKFAERTGMDVTYKSTFEGRLPDETETHLFRIAQEAFTNVARHSGASRVQVELSAPGDFVVLTIEDNGRGLSPDDSLHSSIGMTGMRARARHAGGKFMASKPQGGGLRLEIVVPNKLAGEVHAS